jgi:hypothetical protein
VGAKGPPLRGPALVISLPIANVQLANPAARYGPKNT